MKMMRMMISAISWCQQLQTDIYVLLPPVVIANMLNCYYIWWFMPQITNGFNCFSVSVYGWQHWGSSWKHFSDKKPQSFQILAMFSLRSTNSKMSSSHSPNIDLLLDLVWNPFKNKNSIMI